jgi:4'-phosphopantetheinyl transferase
LTASDRHEAFFNCWTRKEAYIKALGEGLSCPLETFEVTLTPGARARLQAIDGSTEAAAGWWMHSFPPAPGFMGAVVVRGTGYKVQTGWIHTGATTADGAQPAFA